jgi:UDP-N-acetylmuramoyl-tripeptide--D-alanyl-D-alanine ligase
VEREPLGPEGSRLRVDGGRSDARAVVLPIPGEAAAIDFTAALAAAESAVDGPVDPARGLASLAPIPGRMRVRRARGLTVLDDAYNANPASMRAALSTLAECGDGRRVAVLGEMKELGPTAEREHAALADAVVEAGVALLVSCGGLADVLARAVEARGVDVVLAGGAAQASRETVERVRPGDVVLVKASRSVGAERVVDALVGGEGR